MAFVTVRKVLHTRSSPAKHNGGADVRAHTLSTSHFLQFDIKHASEYQAVLQMTASQLKHNGPVHVCSWTNATC